MNVPFLDLKAINARHAAELKAAADRVIDSGWYVLGEEVKAFEAEFAAWVGSPHCVGTSDGLSALILALRGWKELGLLKDGDAVAVPANTYVASVLAITENRLRPVLVEPDEDTLNLGAAKLAAALTPNVKAVLAVHLYGQLADMPAIAQLCRERFPKVVAYPLWLFAEIAICATDLAELIGTAIALELLFGIPLLYGVFLTALDAFLILWLQNKGVRWLEALIFGFIVVIIDRFVAITFCITRILD